MSSDTLYAELVVKEIQRLTPNYQKSRSCRARFPADQSCLDATNSVAASRDESLLLFEALARLGSRLRLPGALRRRPRFARQDLASLGLAELRKLLKSAGDNFSSNGTPLAK